MIRQDAIDAHRRAGNPVLAVMPIHYPREILDSLDILGVELWGPPGPLPDGPSERIQPYVCSLIRNALAFIDGGGTDGVDGILIPNTCDAMMGFASMVADMGDWDRPLFHFHQPRSQDPTTANPFLQGEIERLWHALGKAFDRPCKNDALLEAIERREAIEAAHRKLRQHRRQLPMSERELMELLRADGWQTARDHLAALEAALETLAGEPIHQGPGVTVSGIVPEPMTLLDALSEAGAVLVGDDYASTGRRHGGGSKIGAPLETVAERMRRRPPCPTLAADLPIRLDYLVDLVRRTGSAGLIVHTVRFCEPELFDYPAIKERMKHEEIPVLFVDTEVERDMPGPLVTRLEAFVEMIS